jgi:hypothetical protein
MTASDPGPRRSPGRATVPNRTIARQCRMQHVPGGGRTIRGRLLGLAAAGVVPVTVLVAVGGGQLGVQRKLWRVIPSALTPTRVQHLSSSGDPPGRAASPALRIPGASGAHLLLACTDNISVPLAERLATDWAGRRWPAAPGLQTSTPRVRTWQPPRTRTWTRRPLSLCADRGSPLPASVAGLTKELAQTADLVRTMMRDQCRAEQGWSSSRAGSATPSC